MAEVEAGTLRPAHPPGHLLARRVPRRSRRLQRQAGGGAPWPLRCIKPGLATTVQDLGRPGYYHLGIPLSGGMDRYALRAANLLVGNDEGAAVLEAMFLGPELASPPMRSSPSPAPSCRRRSTASRAPTWTIASRCKAGQVLSFDFLKRGARAYIAVAGGIDVPVVLGSRSTYALGALGGFEGRDARGRRRAAGRRGRVRRARRPQRRRSRCAGAGDAGRSCACCPASTGTASPRRRGERFFEDTWKVAPEADRIGYRFRGGSRSSSSSASSRSAPAPIRPTSSTPAIPTARSRCRAAPNRSCCTATPSRAAATS